MLKTARLLISLSLLLGAATSWAQPATAPPTANASAEPVYVRMDTSLGRVVLQLDAARAPKTVANFVEYVKSGFYDGLSFTRVIPGFMAQGGAYDAQMKQRRPRAPIVYEGDNGLLNKRGSIAMARTSLPNTATSEFFINLADNTSLDGNPDNYGYAVFGRVIRGMSVVDRMATIPTGPGGRFAHDVPKTPIVITSMTVVEKPKPVPAAKN